jgi:hypothetical protein
MSNMSDPIKTMNVLDEMVDDAMRYYRKGAVEALEAAAKSMAQLPPDTQLTAGEISRLLQQMADLSAKV